MMSDPSTSAFGGPAQPGAVRCDPAHTPCPVRSRLVRGTGGPVGWLSPPGGDGRSPREAARPVRPRTRSGPGRTLLAPAPWSRSGGHPAVPLNGLVQGAAQSLTSHVALEARRKHASGEGGRGPSEGPLSLDTPTGGAR